MRLRLPIALACALLLGHAADWKPAENPLTTPWTAKVTADARSAGVSAAAMVRPKWTNLNGLWDYAIVAKDARAARAVRGQAAGAVPRRIGALGREEAAHAGAAAVVPPHVHGAAGEGHAPAAAFRRGGLARRGVRQRQGRGHARRRLRPVHVRHHRRAEAAAREQELVVAVWDPTDTGLQPRGKQVLNPNGIWYTAVSGIWQTVWLEPVPAAYIREIAMTPDLDGKRLRLTVDARAPAEFTATARLRGKAVGRVTGKTGRGGRDRRSSSSSCGRPIRPRSTISRSR